MHDDVIWNALQAELRRRVPASTFDIWLSPLRWGGRHDDRVVLLAPAESRSWIEDRMAGVLTTAARAVTGSEAVRVELHAADDEPSGAATAPAAVSTASAPQPLDRLPLDHGRLHPKYTFEQFVIGDANRFAHAAALAVAEMPGQAYNPLFIVGPPGVGKTHLLHSIAHYIQAYGGGLTVRYTTVERFTNEFIAALQSRDVESFKQRYRSNDVLLVDDVQFLESKVKTEEELFHTFNALQEAGSQLVLASDRPPRDMEALEERMLQRFESGLLVDIGTPDLATRLTVLRKRVVHDGIELAEDAVLDLIAERVTDSIRSLEGALTRIVAYASLTGSPIDLQLAERVLTQLYGPARRAGAAFKPTVERIQTAVAERFGITREELLSSSRSSRVAWPRQVAMYLARQHTDESLPAIGKRFGGRDHSTVLHACRRASERIASDPEAFAAVRDITAALRGEETEAL